MSDFRKKVEIRESTAPAGDYSMDDRLQQLKDKGGELDGVVLLATFNDITPADPIRRPIKIAIDSGGCGPLEMFYSLQALNAGFKSLMRRTLTNAMNDPDQCHTANDARELVRVLYEGASAVEDSLTDTESKYIKVFIKNLRRIRDED